MKKYFINLNGFTYGPFSFEELKIKNLHPSTPIWFEGMGNWIPANQVAELQSLFYTNPQPYYQQPVSQISPDFSQTNPTNPVPNNSNRTLFIILGSVFVVFIFLGMFIFYSFQQRKKRAMDELYSISDSLATFQTVTQSPTGVVNVDTALSIYDTTNIGTADLAGIYTNSKGATIRISGNSDDDLQVNMKYWSVSDNSCNGQTSGTGKSIGSSMINVRTVDGETINFFMSADNLVVVEPPAFSMFHDKCFSYNGSYEKNVNK
jgi:hypothetical protein